MTNRIIWKKGLRVVSVFLVGTLFLFCLLVFIRDFIRTFEYSDKVYPNTYLGEYKLDNVSFDYLDKKIEFYRNDILNTRMVFLIDGNKYTYTLRELGFEIDKDAIINNIINDQNSISYLAKLNRVSGRNAQVYNYKFKYNRILLTGFINELKKAVDVNVVYDGLVMEGDREFSYSPGVRGFILDVDKSVDEIIKVVESNSCNNFEIALVGEVIDPNRNGGLAVIDSKVSSFSTEFNPNISRAINLRTALNYIDGAVIEPGEVFSFYKYAGPYDKSGYVFYYEFVGNGVCQIATTVYNAALLGGLEIVKRYPHKAKSLYVAGGLDATVASYSSGWYVDMQFKNTYDYPIYISAYAIDGVAYVDFWSNHDAKRGKTYATSSEQIGQRGYNSYLHVFENGEEVEKRLITTTWYLE